MLPDNRPARMCFSPVHGRHLWDGVASAAECQKAVAVAQRAMRRCCDNDGDHGKLFPPHLPEAGVFLGDDGFALFTDLRQRMADRVGAAYEGPIEPVACLLSWISGPATSAPADEEELRSFDWRRDAADGTFAPHVDKANQSEYDISALLYLSTSGEDFTGGLFAFNDADCDRLVEPRAGRLLAFTSGFENLHQVRPVHTGERLVLSVWFRREVRGDPSPHRHEPAATAKPPVLVRLRKGGHPGAGADGKSLRAHASFESSQTPGCSPPKPGSMTSLAPLSPRHCQSWRLSALSSKSRRNGCR